MKKKLFYNGEVITMDESQPRAQAVYVENNVIRDVGNFDELRLKYRKAELIDLEGNVMMPGFIEPHAHFDLCSMISAMHNISGIDYPDTEEVICQIRKAVEETPKGRWVMCFGLDYLLNRDLPEINRYWLDEITTEHPVAMIIQSMHTMYINSMGLEKAGITRDTKDTRDGHCIKDEQGEPLGILTEQGFIVPVVHLWLEDKNMNPERLLREEADRWAETGVTTTWVAGYSPLYPDHINLMNSFFNSKGCPIRGDYDITFNSIEGGQVEEKGIKAKNTPRNKMVGIKSWYDGSPYTGNMFMYDNYLENDIMQKKLYVPENQSGERLFSRDRFYEIVKNYHDKGYQLSIHAQGDRAAHEVLGILSRVLNENPREDHRHRLEHCAFLRAEDMNLAAELGVTLSFHTNHIYYYGEALEELVVGKERTEKCLACKSALDHGIRISLHSDAPMYSVNPLRVAGSAVTRRTRKGLLVGPEERITVDQAMRGITIDAAWQLFREKELGSITKGKYADFVILNRDPYTVIPADLEKIRVITTYVDGVERSELKY